MASHSFEKLHMVEHHLIFVDQKKKNAFYFVIDMKMLYSILIRNCLDHI